MESFQAVLMIVPLAIGLWLAYLIGRWADSKGQSFWIGFLVSILFSPLIGGIVVAVLPNRNRW